MLQMTAPSEEVEICRPSSPFAGQRLASLAAMSFVEETLTRPQLITKEHEAENYGQLLASAIYNGALLNRKLWDAWLTALHHGIRFKHEKLWIELSLPETGAPKIAPENRGTRWFADPITQMLILRWRSGSGAKGAKDAPEATICLNAFLGSCRQFDATQKDPCQILLSSAELRWRLRMPGLLVDYARGDGPSISVRSARWSRLVRGRPVYLAKPVRPKKRDTSDESQKGEKSPPPEEFANYLHISLDETKSCLDVALSTLVEFGHFRSASDRSKCEKNLNSLVSSRSIPINESRILKYIIFRIKTRTIHGRRLRGVSAKYLINILLYLKNSLLPYLDEIEDVANMAADDIYEIYSEILSDSHHHDYEKNLNIIQGFHSFIESINPYVALIFDRDRAKILPSNVDANLISASDYSQALLVLNSGHYQDNMCRLLIILGYRAGLRYGEATGLQLCDLRFEENFVELVVRCNVYRPIKSRSGRRILPLDVLLTSAELKELKDWVRKKQENGARPSDLLFSPFRRSDTLPSKSVGVLVNRTLKRVTGDEFARYHHLRHSFASYLLATFLLPRDLRALPRVDGLDGDTISHRRRELISDRLLGHGKLGRAAAHCVSTLCGHASVETTLHSYGHLLDWLVGLYVSRPDAQPNLSLTAGRNLTGQGSAGAVLMALRRARGETIPGKPLGRCAASPALRSLDAAGQFKKGPLKPGTDYQSVLLKAAKRKWNVPPPGLEQSTDQLPVIPSRTSRKRGRPTARSATNHHVPDIGGIAGIERLRADPAAAHAYLTTVRWPDRVMCPSCESEKTYEIGRNPPSGKPMHRKIWKCGTCQSIFSVTSGTPLHRSRASLGDWILALHTICLSSSTAGIRRSDLARRLGSNDQLAGFVYRRIWHAILQTPLRGYLDKAAHPDALAAPGGALAAVGRRATLKGPNSATEGSGPGKAQALPKRIKFRSDTATTLSLEGALAFLLRAAPCAVTSRRVGSSTA